MDALEANPGAGFRRLPLAQLGEAEDGIERGADLVAHVGEELALDAGQLLRRLPRRFPGGVGLASLGDVLQGAHHLQAALAALHVEGVRHPAAGALLQHPVFEEMAPFGVEGLAHGLGHGFPVLRVDGLEEFGEAALVQVEQGVAAEGRQMAFQLRVVFPGPQAGGGDGQAQAGLAGPQFGGAGFHQLFQLVPVLLQFHLGLAQGLLGLLQLADVGEAGDDAVDLAVLHQGLVAQADVIGAPAGPVHRQLEAHRLALQRRLQVGQGLLEAVRRQQLLQGQAADALRRVAEEFGEFPVAQAHPQVPVVDGQAVAGVEHQLLVALLVEFGQLLVVDVDVHPHPGADAAVGQTQGHGAAVGPAPLAGMVAQAVVHLQDGVLAQGLAPAPGQFLLVFRVDGGQAQIAVGHAAAGVGLPGGGVLEDFAPGVAAPHDLGRGFHQGLVAGFRLQGLVLGLADGGDVGVGADDAAYLAVVADGHGAAEHVVPGAVLAAHAQDLLDAFPAGGAGGVAEDGHGPGQVVRVDELAPGLQAAGIFVFAVAEHGEPAGREVEGVAAQVPVPEAVVGGGEGQVEPFPDDLQLPLDALAPLLFLAFLDAAADGGHEPGQPVLEDEVGGAQPEQVHRVLVHEGAGDDDHRHLRLAPAYQVEGVLEGEAGNGVVAQHHVPVALLQGLVELVHIADVPGFHRDIPVAEAAGQEQVIAGHVLDDQDVQRREHGAASSQFFGGMLVASQYTPMRATVSANSPKSRGLRTKLLAPSS